MTSRQPRRPAKPVCSLCGIDDEVTTLFLGDGVYQHTCTGRWHAEPRVWVETGDSGIDDLALEGYTLEWGLYDDLPRCLLHGEPFVEYGIVEHRYKLLNPARYRFLVDRYSHTCLGPSRYTASAFIASALGRLWRRGDLEADGGPATGYWSYNHGISYWALPGARPGGPQLTWKEFAEQHDLDADVWKLP
jgi:hypothetical protein